MFDTLSQFYNSDIWRGFRKVLIDERTGDDGVLYDEYNGEPIVKAYDIVLHHKVPLTIENVNDYNVSLNPDNVMIVSQKSHNEIHARFGFMAQRKVYYVYGAPCAGKTSFVRSIKGNSDLVVDKDDIWQCLTGGKRYNKPKALNTNVFTVWDCLIDMVRTRTGKWERAFVIEGGARQSDRARMINLLGAEPMFINTDKETCLLRLKADSERSEPQKAEWEKYIERWFEEFTE